jgi:nitric oxide reductase NorE protein
MTTEMASPPKARSRRGHIPGEPGLWLLLCGDMLMFGVFFSAITLLCTQHPEVFDPSQKSLHLGWGVVNTIILLTSSLFVVIGMRLARERHRLAPRFFLAAIPCGLMFAGVKAIEYTSLLGNDHGPAANDFYMYYFIFTGIHLLHVIVGMCVLAVATRVSRPTTTVSFRMPLLEGIASFWHLVDMLWIMLFATLYMVR